MSKPEFVTVTITAPDHEQLASICRTLVEERLAACANIIPQISSIYHWDSKIMETREAIALLHTRAELFPTLERKVVSIHHFMVPQVVSLPMRQSSEEYLAWILESTNPL